MSIFLFCVAEDTKTRRKKLQNQRLILKEIRGQYLLTR
jgi:hypothetical protein